MEVIVMQGENDDKIEFEVIETTRLGGVDYYLVCDTEDKESAYIIKDVSKTEEETSVYEFVEDDNPNKFSLYTILPEGLTLKEYKIGKTMWPLRIGVTGEVVTPGGGAEMLYLLGKEESLKRLLRCIDRLKNA